MSRINNLFNMHKKRCAKITDDSKELHVYFEGVNAHLKEPKIQEEFTIDELGIKVLVECERKNFFIKINLQEPNRELAYRLFLVVAYLLGHEIVLYYKVSDFPCEIPHYFNFGGYPFDSFNQRRLILSTKENLVRGYELLIKNDSYFSIIVPFLLSINTIPYYDVRYFSEFSLLEHLAKKCESQNKIFIEENELGELKSLSKKLLDNFETLQNSSEISILSNEVLQNKIKNFFNEKNLNQKGNAKDKIFNFVMQFKSPELQEFSEFVREWNDLRNKKGLAHGNSIDIEKSLSEREIFIEKKLHEFLSWIVYDELHSKEE